MDRLTREQIILGAKSLGEAMNALAVAQERLRMGAASLRGSEEGDSLQRALDSLEQMIRHGNFASEDVKLVQKKLPPTQPDAIAS